MLGRSRRLRHRWARRRQLGADQMYWPGRVAPGLDPVVLAEKVHEVCKVRMDGFDRLSREERDRLNEEGVRR